MSEADDSASHRGAGVKQLHGHPAPPPKPVVSFDRRELDTILRLYGRMVADGRVARLRPSIFSRTGQSFRSSADLPKCRYSGSKKIPGLRVGRAPIR